MTYTHTTHRGHIHFTRIEPLSREIVRFSLTARIPQLLTRVTMADLALFEALILTKTKKKSKSQIEEYLRQYGIDLSVHASRTGVTLTGSVRKAHVDRAVTLIAEILFEPALDREEFMQKRQLLLEANREAHDNARRIAQIAFINTMYPNEPRLHLDTLHEERTHITRAVGDRVRTIGEELLRGSWYVSVVGDSASYKGFEPLVDALKERAAAYIPIEIAAHTVPKAESFTTVPSKTNVEVLLGNIGVVKNDDLEFVACDFGIDVLGKVGAFSGRLMSTVREKEGLTYGIYASTHAHHKGDPFHFVIRTFFMAKDYKKGVAATLRELTTLYEKGITARELIVFKEISANQYVLAHESNKTRLDLYHGLITRGYSESSYREYQEKVAALTVAEVGAALRHNIDPKKLVLSAAGPISPDGTPLITGAS